MKSRGGGFRVFGKGEGISSLCPIMLVLLLGLAAALAPASASAMPVPVGGQYFTYGAGASPVAVSEPSVAQPVGLGSVTGSGDKVSIQVGLEAFEGPVDVYLGISMPKIDPDNIYILIPGNNFQPLSAGLVPWKANVTGPVDEGLFGDIPVSALPSGSYIFYVLVTPAGRLDTYYLWQTQADILSLTVKKFGEGSATDNAGGIDCGDVCTASYALGAAVTLSAVPGEGQAFLKWAGCDVPSGETCTLVINKDRSVTSVFGTEPELKPNVKIINENVVQCLTVTNDTYTFDLAKCPDQATELSKLSPGDVLLVNAGDYAIRNVTAVDGSNPGHIVAETVAGELSDLADEGTMAFSGSLIPSESTPKTVSLRSAATDPDCTMDCNYTDIHFCGTGVIEHDGENLNIIDCPNGGTAGLVYNPKCTFTCKATFTDGVEGTASLYLEDLSYLTANITGVGSFVPPVIDMHVDFNQGNDITARLDASIKADVEELIFAQTYGSYQIWVLNFVPTFLLYGGVKGEVKANVKTSLHTDLTFDIGVNCSLAQKGCSTYSNNPATFYYNLQTPNVCGDADIKVFLKPNFEFRLYGILGFQIYPYPYLQLQAHGDTYTNSLLYDLYWGTDINIGVDGGFVNSDAFWFWNAPSINVHHDCLVGNNLCSGAPRVSTGQTATIEKPAGNPLYTNLREMPITFKGSGENSCAALVRSCVWDFGDGSPQQEVNVLNNECLETTHTYATDRDYIAKLTITYDSGATATDDVIIRVKSSQPLTPDNVQITHPQVMAGSVPLDDTNLVKWDKPKTCETIRGHAICSSEVSRFYNYRVYRRAFDSADALLPDPTVVTVTQNTYADAFGLNEAKLCYQVTSLDGYGNESDPTAEKCEILTSLPVATLVPFPMQLQPASTSIPLKWDEIVGNNIRYTIERDGVPVATVTTPFFHDTGLLPNKTYCYKIIVTKNGLMKRTGTQTCLTTSSDVIAPATPTGVSVKAVSTTELSLSWDASTDNVGVSGYRIYKKYGGVYRYFKSVTDTSLSVPGLMTGQTYCFVVSAYDAAGNESQKSAETCATTEGGTDTEAPTVPAGITATAVSATEIYLSWTASTDNIGVAGYEIYITNTVSPLMIVSVNSGQTIHLSPSTEYCYQVRAFDAAGNKSAKSVQACATTSAPPDTQAPSVPTLNIDPGATSVALGWSASTDNVGVTGYEVYRNNLLLKTVTTTYTSDSGLLPSTEYCYRVLAFDAAGNKSGLSKKNCFMTSP